MKVLYNGQQVDAEEVEFLTRREDWNEYQLANGAIIRMKTVVSDVFKILYEVDLEGTQVYQVRSTHIIRVKQ